MHANEHELCRTRTMNCVRILLARTTGNQCHITAVHPSRRHQVSYGLVDTLRSKAIRHTTWDQGCVLFALRI